MFRSQKLLVLALLALLFPSCLSMGETIFMPGAPEVDTLIGLYQQYGRIFPTSSFPISKGELDHWSRTLAESAPSSSDEIKAYRDTILRMDPMADHISADAEASLQYFYRSQNVSFDPGLDRSLQAIDFQRLFLDELPFFRLAFDFSRDDTMELSVRMEDRREYRADPFSSTNLWEDLSLYGNPFAIENQNLYRGILWYNFGPLQIELGRDKVQMGPAKSSLLLNPDLPFMDVLRVRMPLQNLTGDLLISSLENRAAPVDVTPNLGGSSQDFGSSTILFVIHRFEYAFQTVRLGIAGSVVLVKDNNAFQLGDFFPVFSWHQANLGTNNMAITLDGSWAPVPGLAITGQFALDDVNLTNVGIVDSGVPTIPAWILTAEYTLPLGSGLSTEIYLEYGYTHYLWGNYAWSASGSNALAKAIYRMLIDNGNIILPLTSPYGPGATWVEVSAAFRGSWWIDAKLSVRYLARMTDGSGSAVNLVTTPYSSSSVIENAPQVGTWSVALSTDAIPFGFLKFYLQPAIYFRNNQAWIELSLGATIKADGTAYLSLGE
jgi:hypothetical protein